MPEPAQDEGAAVGEGDHPQDTQAQQRHDFERRRAASASPGSGLDLSTLAGGAASAHYPLPSAVVRSRSHSSASAHYPRRPPQLRHVGQSSDMSALSVEVAVAEASKNKYSPSRSRPGLGAPSRQGRSRSISVPSSGAMGTSRPSSAKDSRNMTQERHRRSATQIPSGRASASEEEEEAVMAAAAAAVAQEDEEEDEEMAQGQAVIRRHRPQRSRPSVLELFNIPPATYRRASSTSRSPVGGTAASLSAEDLAASLHGAEQRSSTAAAVEVHANNRQASFLVQQESFEADVSRHRNDSYGESPSSSVHAPPPPSGREDANNAVRRGRSGSYPGLPLWPHDETAYREEEEGAAPPVARADEFGAPARNAEGSSRGGTLLDYGARRPSCDVADGDALSLSLSSSRPGTRRPRPSWPHAQHSGVAVAYREPRGVTFDHDGDGGGGSAVADDDGSQKSTGGAGGGGPVVRVDFGGEEESDDDDDAAVAPELHRRETLRSTVDFGRAGGEGFGVVGSSARRGGGEVRGLLRYTAVYTIILVEEENIIRYLAGSQVSSAVIFGFMIILLGRERASLVRHWSIR